MKKTLISSALRIIPKKLQNKALCKALNYLCEGQSLASFDGKVIKLHVSDLRRNWSVTCVDNQFQTTRRKTVNVDVKTKFDIAMQSQNKASLMEAIDHGDIEIIGDDHLTNEFTHIISQINERRLINLANHLFSFLKVKSPHPPRLDINTVTLSDLKVPADVDFIISESIKLESRDLEKALSLMLLAKEVRPNGQLVLKKISEYQQKMS